MNRISVLLKVSDTYRLHEMEEKKLKFSLKEVFDYTNIYMVILDDKMNIKTCSFKLAKDLEYNNYKDIIGMSWTEFIRKEDLKNIEIVHTNIVQDTEKYQKSLRELTSTLLTKSGKTISVKWFNSRIKNGHVSTFSIGIPYNRKVTVDDEVDSIRAYWKHVLDKDETTLRALKTLS
jgi:transcriptional regulator with PAS, ATPase and Fis domain